MKHFFYLSLVLMSLCSLKVEAQERLLTMEEAVLGTGLQVENLPVTWRPDSQYYTVVEEGVVYDVELKSGERKVLTSLEKINALLGTSLKQIPPYTLTGKGTMRFYAGRELVGIDPVADTIVHRYAIPEGAENPLYADEGRFLYTRENNLYWSDRAGNEYAITQEKDKNIVSGQSVSRNEFGIMGGLFPAPDKFHVAFFQKDERHVSTFPLLDITTRIGSLREVKYPMAGMASERVRLGIYNYETQQIVWVNVTDFTEERYLTCISWSPDSKTIYIQVLDRSQKQMHLNAYNAADGSFIRTILEEKNEKYVEPQYPLHFLKSDPDKFIYTTSNRDGYRNLYLCSLSTGAVERLTKVDADVELVAERGRSVFYTSAEVSPVENHLFRLDMKSRKVRRLTPDAGWHTCNISPDGNHFIDTYSSLNVPRVVRLASCDGKRSEELLRAADPSAELNYGAIELGTVKSADGKYDNYYRLIKPHDFDPTITANHLYRGNYAKIPVPRSSQHGNHCFHKALSVSFLNG